MDIFDVLAMIGGLSLFLFGMNVMGDSLERRAGNSLRTLLAKLTTNKYIGLLTGLAVTAVIQSSSATTVMVVGFVNSGLMTLAQAINVIMGANIGTTVTAWILSLAGIESSNIFIRLLKPTSFTPILALIGVILYIFIKDSKKRDTGLILLGFATLMFGMDAMSDAVSGLKSVPAFTQLFILFKNPILGVLAGAILTGIIQSSSASVGILQALAATGAVSYGAAIPIIMGQNIGTCVTALLSSVGTTTNARRAALVHLSFNVIGTAICLCLYYLIRIALAPAFLDASASLFGIAVAHSAFNLFCTLILLPMSGLLERIVIRLVPDTAKEEDFVELDERLMTTPPVALSRCHELTVEMANAANEALAESFSALGGFDSQLEKKVLELEKKTDRYEDILGSYLVKLSGLRISAQDSSEAAMLLKLIGDFERIGDHSKNILEAAQEMHEKALSFTGAARSELSVISSAASEIMELAIKAFREGDLEAAAKVEPLEQVIDDLRTKLRSNHISRLQQGICSIEAGFVWSDLLTNIERVADHCSNIAGYVIDMPQHHMNLHSSLRAIRAGSEEYLSLYKDYHKKYAL